MNTQLPNKTFSLSAPQLETLHGPLSSFWCRCQSHKYNVTVYVYSHPIIDHPIVQRVPNGNNMPGHTYTLFLPDICRFDPDHTIDLGMSLIKDTLEQIQELTELIAEPFIDTLYIEASTYRGKEPSYAFMRH